MENLEDCLRFSFIDPLSEIVSDLGIHLSMKRVHENQREPIAVPLISASSHYPSTRSPGRHTSTQIHLQFSPIVLAPRRQPCHRYTQGDGNETDQEGPVGVV
jgi:hypothetical protein